MGRPHRAAQGGYVYHVLNRANARMRIFDDDADYEAFERVLARGRGTHADPVVGLLPHAQPLAPDGLAAEGWRTLAVRRLADVDAHPALARPSPFDRVRPSSTRADSNRFPVQEDEHFYTVARYVERNALRANLVRRAEQWTMGQSLPLAARFRGRRQTPGGLAGAPQGQLDRSREQCRRQRLNCRLSAAACDRGCPFGDEAWSDRVVRRFGLETTLRPRGRPKKGS